MAHNLIKIVVLPLKHPLKRPVDSLSVKGAIIIAAGIVFVATLVGLFA